MGGQATFSVQVALSSTPLKYQWLFNGRNVPGATNAVVTLTNVQTDHAGTYAVVVGNAAGSVTNISTAQLTVPYVFTTIAGETPFGSTDGPATSAQFNFPSGVAVDSLRNIYVTDTANHTIRKITSDATRTNWTVTTFAGKTGRAGSSDGTGSDPRFNNPIGIAVDNAGNVYVADTGNHAIRKITPTGRVSTIAGQSGSFGSADGIANNARFNGPNGVAVDAVGNVFVADSENHTIRKITPAGVVSTLAGQPGNSGSSDGAGNKAQFNFPCGVAVDSGGNVFVADTYNHTIRLITSAGVVTTLWGSAGVVGSDNGTGANARFNTPRGLTVDSAGNVYVADSDNELIRKITRAGVVANWGGALGFADSDNGKFLSVPSGVAADSGGNVYVADSGNGAIQQITAAGAPSTLAGPSNVFAVSPDADGKGTNVRFYAPCDPVLDSTGSIYFVEFYGHVIRKITAAGVVSTLAGQAGVAGYADGRGTNALFNLPTAVIVDGADNVYVSDGGNNAIRKITPGGAVSTLAGQGGMPGGYQDGTGTNALFGFLTNIAVDSATNLYVTDLGNQVIRRIRPDATATNWAVDTIAGQPTVAGREDGVGFNARFDSPLGLAADRSGNLYVADTSNHTIRKITPDATGANWTVSTLAGKPGVPGYADARGSEARFSYPFSVGLDSVGNVYVPEVGNLTIRKITTDGWVTTLAGKPGFAGTADGLGSNARFDFPTGPVGNNNAGTLYVSDFFTGLIRRGIPATAPSVVTAPESRTVMTGANVTFTVAATDTTPLSYQWQFNGVSLPGATSSTLVLTNVQASQAGQYAVVVASATGVTSPAAMLTVTPPAPFQLVALPIGKPPTFHLRVTAPAGRSVVLQASTNLTDWLSLLTNSALNGTFEFKDPDTPKFNRRFYRGLTR